MTLEHLEQVAAVCGYILTITSAAVLLWKPLREKVFGLKDISDGVKCLLRSDMLRMYYKHQEENKIRQHERQNFEAEYAAYKALGGNSFMNDIYHDVCAWKVVT